MKIFVTGASGFQGGNITQALINNNHEVSTLKRTSGVKLENRNGLTVYQGDLADKNSISKALKTSEAAVYNFPLIFNIEEAKTYTKNFIEAAEEQNIQLIVFNSGFDLPKANTGLLALDLKIAIKELFDNSSLNVITLTPDIYIDNLAAPWSIPTIVNHGVLPYPVTANTKAPFVSHIDLAKYVTSAIEKPELAGKTLPIGGNLFTGEEIASAIAQKIDKPVNFVGVKPNDFEQQLIPAFGDLAAKEISNLYRYVEQNQTKLISKDFKQTQEILNVTPQSLNEWVDSINWTL